jgi:hypothetical protein
MIPATITKKMVATTIITAAASLLRWRVRKVASSCA